MLGSGSPQNGTDSGGGGGLSDAGLRDATKMERDAKKLLKREGIDEGIPIVAAKRGTGTQGRPLRNMLLTNVYGLFMMEERLVYRYDVTIKAKTIPTGKEVQFTMKAGGDAPQVDRRAKCYDALKTLQLENPDYFKLPSNCIYYDLQSILYSLQELNAPKVFEGIFMDSRCSNATIEINPVATGGLIQLGDLIRAYADLSMKDASLEQFLNIATSQKIFDNREDYMTFSASVGYMLHPEKHGFARNESPIFPDNGTYLGLGFGKSVQQIEGPSDNATSALVIESKKTPFHIVENVLEKYGRAGLTDRHSRILTGLQVQTIYGEQPRSLKIRRLSSFTAHTKKFDWEGGQISVFDYFQQRYGITLQHPDLPLIESKGRDGDSNYFPMELCVVKDNQRAKMHQQTMRQTSEMIRICAAAPSSLLLHIDRTVRSLQLDADNEYLQKSGIDFIADERLNVPARALSPPSMLFGRGETQAVRESDFTWIGRTYLIPATIPLMGAYLFNGIGTDQILMDDFRNFIDRVLQEARRRGMDTSISHVDFDVKQTGPISLTSVFERASARGIKFIMIAHPDGADEMHHTLKYCERKFEIITQGMKLNTIRNVLLKNQNLTVANVVNKMNVKLGGLNFSLVMNDPATKEIIGQDTLFLGFGMNHPAGGLMNMDLDTNGSGKNGHSKEQSDDDNYRKPLGIRKPDDDGNDYYDVGSSGNGNGTGTDTTLLARPPSVIGFSANMGKNPFEFIGDFVYQEMRRDEKYDKIVDIVQTCVETYRRNRGHFPKRLMLYRNGCDEGRFAQVLKYEVPLIKHAMKKINCAAKVTLIVPNKLQNIRFFLPQINPRDRPPQQNIPPGTVIDSYVVSPHIVEMYINSHRALQGTCRTPRYSLLYDDNHLTMDQLQGITNHLCYGHQIVYSPTSLPSPVMIALEYAKRGRNLYNKRVDVLVKEKAQRDKERENGSSGLVIDFHDLQDELCFRAVDVLASRRINA